MIETTVFRFYPEPGWNQGCNRVKFERYVTVVTGKP